MTDNLLLHAHTHNAVENFVTTPSQGLLISGVMGAGKPTLAQDLIATILQINPTKLDRQAYFRHLKPQKNTITIEAVRQLQDFLHLKTTGRQTWRRAILIEDAQCLTVEAQNALLKLIEEPPADTLVCLTATPHSLLPTITSRLQHISIAAPSEDASSTFFRSQGYSEAAIKRAFYISQGQVGLMVNLLAQDKAHPLLQQINTVKQLLSRPQFERLAQIDQLAKQKESLPELLWALERVAQAALTSAAQKQNYSQVRRWQQGLREILTARSNLSANPQAKLLLTHLLLTI